MAERLLIVAGDVTDVQLTSETLVAEDGRRKPAHAGAAGRIISRMRVFIQEVGGKEHNYDFEEAKVGVRQGHRCGVARGRCQNVKEPVNLVLYNFSTDERDVFEDGVKAYLARKKIFGPRWKAFGASLVMVLFGVFFSRIILHHDKTMSMLESVWWASFFSFLAFPIFWGVIAFWDRITENSRFKKAREALLADIQQRFHAFAKPA